VATTAILAHLATLLLDKEEEVRLSAVESLNRFKDFRFFLLPDGKCIARSLDELTV
jgi:hypothetical protein